MIFVDRLINQLRNKKESLFAAEFKEMILNSDLRNITAGKIDASLITVTDNTQK